MSDFLNSTDLRGSVFRYFIIKVFPATLSKRWAKICFKCDYFAPKNAQGQHRVPSSKPFQGHFISCSRFLSPSNGGT